MDNVIEYRSYLREKLIKKRPSSILASSKSADVILFTGVRVEYDEKPIYTRIPTERTKAT